MRFFRTLSLAVLMVAGSQTLSAQNIQVPKAYMFGFVASFNDSTVYFTDIQELDSVWVTKKKQYISGKGNYSYQLRNFFTQQRDLPNRTCVIIGSVKRKDVEKKYAKMKQNYLVKNKGNTLVEKHFGDKRFLEYCMHEANKKCELIENAISEKNDLISFRF